VRAISVMSDHNARAFGRPHAFRRSAGPSFQCLRRELQRNLVACVCAAAFGQLLVHSEPVASLAVWLERGSKGEAIEGAFDRRRPRGELRTGVLW